MLILTLQIGLYLNPIYNGNWPDVVIERIQDREQLVGATTSRLPKLTEAEIQRFKGTSDFLGVNYYMTHLIKDNPEPDETTLSFNTDVRVQRSVDASWKIGPNGFPVSNFLGNPLICFVDPVVYKKFATGLTFCLNFKYFLLYLSFYKNNMNGKT